MRNLIVVPSGGDESFIASWMEGSPSYDLMLLDYTPDGSAPCDFATYVHRVVGFKTEIIARAIEAHRELIDSYDAVWLPDGDLQIAPADLERMFSEFHRLELCLAQPSISGPYVNVGVTGRRRWCRYRYTDFVEVMCPLVTPWALHRIKDTFPMTRSAWGQDWVWPERLPPGKVAIFDHVSAYHSKPCEPNGPVYRTFQSIGVDWFEEDRIVRGLFSPRSQGRTLRWVLAEIGGREIGFGHVPNHRQRTPDERNDATPRTEGLTLVLDPTLSTDSSRKLLEAVEGLDLPWEALASKQQISSLRSEPEPEPDLALKERTEGPLSAVNQASYRWVLFGTEGTDLGWLERALDDCRQEASLAAVGAPDGRLLLDRAAWATLVGRGLISRLTGTAAETAELSAALLSGGWRVAQPISPDLETALERPGVDIATARSLGEASVWMDGYRLLPYWPFRNLKERALLHWFVHAAGEAWRWLWPGAGETQVRRAYRRGRLGALLKCHFGHSAWVSYLRHPSWAQARASQASRLSSGPDSIPGALSRPAQ